MGIMLKAIDIVLETHFKFGFSNGSFYWRQPKKTSYLNEWRLIKKPIKMTIIAIKE